jgi:ABC-type dipeptide/oligopeptide/nickel transport system permease component
MHYYILRRLLQLIPTLFAASLLIFLIITLAPGDPAAMRLGSEATAEQIEQERQRLGLDRPLPVRYVIWLSDVLRLDLGDSLYTGRPVTEMIGEAFPKTVQLSMSALAFSLLIGLPLGMAAALHRDKPADVAITSFNALGLAIPNFWLAILMLLFFSVQLHWLPPSGAGNPNQGFVANLPYLIMPVMSIAFSNLSVFSRFMRTALIDVLFEDYVRTARAKGLVERVVVSRHALKNALIPVVTIIGIQFGRLLGGAVVTETVFAYPGIGRLTVNAILNRDYPVVQATLLLVVLIFLFANTAVDLLYGYIDPRVRIGRS